MHRKFATMLKGRKRLANQKTEHRDIHPRGSTLPFMEGPHYVGTLYLADPLVTEQRY